MHLAFCLSGQVIEVANIFSALRAHHKPTFGVEIARASHKLVAHERRLLADCEDATDRVRLPADKQTRLAHRSVEGDAWRKLACLIHSNIRVSCAPQGIRQRGDLLASSQPSHRSIARLYRVFQRRGCEDDAAAVQVQRAYCAHGRKQRVDCKGHQRPPKMFSKSRFVPAG
jgi:hypothetical protein